MGLMIEIQFPANFVFFSVCSSVHINLLSLNSTFIYLFIIHVVLEVQR